MFCCTVDALRHTNANLAACGGGHYAAIPQNGDTGEWFRAPLVECARNRRRALPERRKA